MRQVAVVIPTCKDRILIMRRSGTDPKNPLKWDFPGGHLEEGESPKQGALRELEEESNLKPQPKDLKKLTTIEGEGLTVHLYTVAVCNPAEVKLRDGEHDQYCWTTLTHLGCYPLAYGVERAIEEMK